MHGLIHVCTFHTALWFLSTSPNNPQSLTEIIMIEIGGKKKKPSSAGVLVSPAAHRTGAGVVGEVEQIWPFDWDRRTRLYEEAQQEPYQPTRGLREHVSRYWNSLLGRSTTRAVSVDGEGVAIPHLITNLQHSAAKLIVEGHYREATSTYEQANQLASAIQGREGVIVRACISNDRALLLKHLGHFTAAEEVLVAAINDIDSAGGAPLIEAHLVHQLGLLYHAVGERESAARMLLRAVQTLPSKCSMELRAEFQSDLGLALWRARRRDEAMEAFTKSAQLFDKVTIPTKRRLDTHLSAGSALIHAGRYGEAEEHIRAAIELRALIACDHIDESPLWNMLGFCFARREMIQEAQQAYRNAIRVSKESLLPDQLALADAHFNLATLYAVKTNPERVDYHLAEAARLYDKEKQAAEKRERHFRSVFDKHFVNRNLSLSSDQMKNLLMLSAHAGLEE
jgi:tetratricopeptide (TPR) repeat protein